MAHVTVSMTFARSTRLSAVFTSAKVSWNAFFALLSHRQIRTSVTDGLSLWTFPDQARPERFRCLAPTAQLKKQQLIGGLLRQISDGKIVAVTDWRVPIAVLETGNALAVVARVAHKERLASRALRPHCVIEALETLVQLVRFRTRALRMSVAATLNTAIFSNKTEMTSTHIRLKTIPVKTTLVS